MTRVTIPPKLEHAVLTMVRNGGGKASWHRLATWLPSFDVPLVPDLMVVLQDLKSRGLVTQTLVGGGMDRWAITAAGEAYLDRRPPPAGPLSIDELAQFAQAVHGGFEATMAAVRPFVSDGLKLWAVLRQMLAANPADAQRVAELGLLLPKSERGPFARELLDDPRAEVREALFRGWTPVETDVPGRPLPTLPDPELDELLRCGLGDPSPGVREAAAALTFLAVRGASLVGELTVNLGAPESGVRWWSILALGSAADPITRELLIDLAQGEDLAEASAAIRALAQRRDGRDAWFAGLADPRPDVHNAAIFALATVVTDLDDDDLARLAADSRPPLQEALATYRARSGNA